MAKNNSDFAPTAEDASEKWTRERALSEYRDNMAEYYGHVEDHVDKLIVYLQTNREHIGAFNFTAVARLGDLCENPNEPDTSSDRFSDGVAMSNSNEHYDKEVTAQLRELLEKLEKKQAMHKMIGGGGGLGALLAGVMGSR